MTLDPFYPIVDNADDTECTDLLVRRDHAPLSYRSRRIETKNTHGTGCTLSSSIAACLARGMTLETAISTAHEYLHQAICHSDQLDIGSGHGPVHHFHAQWS